MKSAFFAVFRLVAQPRQSTKRRTAKRVVRKKTETGHTTESEWKSLISQLNEFTA